MSVRKRTLKEWGHVGYSASSPTAYGRLLERDARYREAAARNLPLIAAFCVKKVRRTMENLFARAPKESVWDGVGSRYYVTQEDAEAMKILGQGQDAFLYFLSEVTSDTERDAARIPFKEQFQTHLELGRVIGNLGIEEKFIMDRICEGHLLFREALTKMTLPDLSRSREHFRARVAFAKQYSRGQIYDHRDDGEIDATQLLEEGIQRENSLAFRNTSSRKTSHHV